MTKKREASILHCIELLEKIKNRKWSFPEEQKKLEWEFLICLINNMEHYFEKALMPYSKSIYTEPYELNNKKGRKHFITNVLTDKIFPEKGKAVSIIDKIDPHKKTTKAFLYTIIKNAAFDLISNNKKNDIEPDEPQGPILPPPPDTQKEKMIDEIERLHKQYPVLFKGNDCSRYPMLFIANPFLSITEIHFPPKQQNEQGMLLKWRGNLNGLCEID